MKSILIIFSILTVFFSFSQGTPNNCNGAIPGCTSPNFGIQPTNNATNIVDFTSGSVSNPSSNPNGGNSGCLLSGETSSTFITISVVTGGTLQWSIEGASGFGCFDWIMWPYLNGQTTCAGISGNTLPPVSCNWNGNCEGFTGMANPLPVSGDASNFEAPLNVTAGQTFLLCLSNYSGTSQAVNFQFFGTANVACTPSAADQTICLGNSATVTIATPGLPNPSFNWLVTTGVSNPSGGTNVIVTPTVTTTYQVEVTNPATPTSPAFSETIDFTITVATPPAPSAGPDQTICLGQPILLSGTEGVAANNSSWSSVLPSGMTPPATASFSPNFSTLTPTVTVNQPGTYKFIFREVSTVCGTLRDTMIVTVTELQQLVSKTDPSCGGYSDGTIEIVSANATSYSFDNGVTWQATNTATGFSAGTYNVCSKNAQGCQKCSAITLTSPVPVTVTVSNDTLICRNGTATLNASGSNGTSFTYDWRHTSSTAGVQPVMPTANTYYTVQAVNQNGCVSAPDSIYVTLRAPLSGDITTNLSICPGYPQNLNAAVIGGIGTPYTYTWSSGEVQNGATTTISANPSATQTYTVTVKDACETTPLVLTSEVQVALLPVPQFTVVDGSICEPAIFELSNTTDPATMTNWYWKISDGQTFGSVANISTLPMYEGVYAVQLVVTSPEGCIDSVTVQNFLISNPKPVAEFKWSPNPVQMFNTAVTFANQSIHGDTYYWSFQEGIPGVSTAENPKIQFPDGQVGNYEVMLITTSEFGCIDTAYHIVSVLPEVLLYAPNAFTPDDNEFNQTWRVFMEGVDLADVTLRVFDRWGEVVWESHNLEESWDGTYNGRLLQNGTYIWTIRAKDAINDNVYNYNGHVSILR